MSDKITSIISAANLKLATDSINTDTLLSSIMDIITAASDGGFYSAILPYVVSDKQNSALINLGYLVSTDVSGAFTTIDWSNPQAA